MILWKILHHKGEQHLRYYLKIWNKKVAFDILNYISENVTMNHAISIVRYWKFDSNYEKSLYLKNNHLI